MLSNTSASVPSSSALGPSTPGTISRPREIAGFGRRGFTGKLPMTWPRTLAQEPINVGDADYDPLYPFGYGLKAH